MLNAELPQNTRYHIVQEFNRGVYNYIIATDDASRLRTATSAPAGATAPALAGELDGLPVTAQPGETVPAATAAATVATVAAEAAPGGKRKRKHRAADAEFGVARGIDFQDVAVVFNFDFPVTVESYTHRVSA